MKNISQILFNPFEKIAGLKSLLLGLAIMLLTSAIAYFSNTRFDGVIDVHSGDKVDYYYYLVDGLVAWLSMVVIFYPVILFVTKFKARFVDVAGTFLLARFPMIIDALILFYLKNSEVNKFLESLVLKTNVVYNIQVMDWMLFVGSMLLMIMSTVWFVALCYNSYKVNSNLKGVKAVWIFVVCMLIAEILSKVLFYYINSTI